MQVANNMPEAPWRKRSARSVFRHIPRIDMTPMVDLGFLLVAFFVMTTRLSEPAVARLNMPKETDQPPTKLGESNALTVLLGANNKVYCYHGEWNAEKVVETNFSVLDGLGRIIRKKQDFLATANISKEGKDGLMLLIKAGKEAQYSMVVDALDEAVINGVKRYALVKTSSEEEAFLQSK